MSVLTRDQFIACLKKSQAIDEKSVDAWMSRVTDQDAPQLAAKLVRDQLLTSWQAKYLLSGRWRLSLGSYHLLSRINRDELGDRFEAIHRQLARKVVIQIFPSTIGEDAQMQQRLRRVIQQLTELDHRALVHVYDVDQEGGRYFVVTEFIQSKPLSDLPRGSLDGKILARIIEDLLHGVLHAHLEGIVHGGIVQENILVTPTGEPKLQGIPTAAVRSEILANADSLRPEQDFDALAQIGRTVLQEIPPEQRGEGEPELVELLEKLSDCIADRDGIDKVLQGFADWRAQFNAPSPSPTSVALVMTGDSNSGPSNDGATASLTMASHTHRPGEEGSPIDRSDDGSQHRPKSKRGLSGLWTGNRRPVMVIMIGALCVVLAAATSAYYAISVVDRPDTQENSGPKKRRGKKKDLVSKPLKLENLPKGDGLLSSNRTREQFDPVAAKKKFADMHAQQKKQSKQSEPRQPEWESQAASTPAVTEVANANPTQAPVESEGVAKTATSSKLRGTSKKRFPDSASKIKEVAGDQPNPDDATVVNANGAEAKQGVAATGGKKASTGVPTKTAGKTSSKSAAKKQTKTKPLVGNPFKVLPATIDLPLFTDLDDFKIADLVLSEKHLISLKLLTGPEVCKSKVLFDLVRSESNKQLWDVRLQRRKRETPVPIAQFQKTPSDFLFRWLPAASQYDEANYIRNCKIKASSPDYLGWVGLRKPLKIEKFVFPENKTSVKLDVDLQWLPNPENLKIELTPFSIEKRVKGKDRGNVYLEPKEITRNLPGIVFFRKDEKYRFLFLRVDADVRAKLKLQCQMYVLGGTGKVLPLRKTNEMEELANALKLRKQEAMLRSQQAETADLPNGVTKTEFNQLKKELGRAADLAVQQSDVAEDYTKIVSELANRRIPFEVFFELGQQRIKLAYSEPQEFEPK